MQRFNRPFLLAFLVVALAAYGLMPASEAVAAASPDFQAIDNFVQAQRQKHRIPGVALVITHRDEIIFANGYGTAGQGRPMTPDTPMYIGSTFKAFTALAIMQLVEQGKVDLDASVRTYLPWFRVADEEASATITVRHLLYHTSGLSEYGYNKTLPPEMSMEAAVRDLASARPTAPVGTTHQYFNPNYATLGLIVETVAGQSYGAYVQQHIFAPLQMAHSYTDPGGAVQDGLAQGHSKLFGFPVPRNPPFRPSGLPDGYVISTARDMGHFLLAMQQQGVYGAARVLSPESVKVLQTPPPQVAPTTYAMGWSVETWRGTQIVYSNGAAPAFMSAAFSLPARQQGLVVLLNQEYLLDHLFAFRELNDGILDLLMGQPPRADGLSMRLIGWAMLAGFLITVAFVLRSLVRLRGWSNRARALSHRQLLRDIAPHYIVPALLVIALLQGGAWLFGRPFSVEWVGFYYLPDVLLWMAISTIPDLLVGLYKTGVVITQRMIRPSPSVAELAQPATG